MITLVVAGLVGVASSRGASTAPPRWALHGPYSPKIRSANFVDKIDNRYFPLAPGTAFHYRGYSGQTAQTDDMVVTRQTKRILGIRCTVVRDTVSEHGKPVERTFDWYAQDKQGNVWYMGEDSLELKNGRFVRAGDSWQSGVKGAKPGIIMQGEATARRRLSAGVLPARWRARPGARSRCPPQGAGAPRDIQAAARHGRVESRGAAVGEEVLRRGHR
jgi:hypothetical protein